MIFKKYFFSAFVFAAACSAFAGVKEVGNGGNAVYCTRLPGPPQVELLDYYELRLNGGRLSLDPQLNSYEEMLNELFTRWTGVAPVRMAQYKLWLKEFKNDAGIYPDVNIPAIPDTGTIVIPNGCELRPIAFQRADSEVLPGVKRYTINKDLWALMPEIQKAGLVLHELIYREAIQAAHVTSFPTRYFTGFLSSVVPDSNVYTSVASKLPLLWGEYGGGAVLEFGAMGKLGFSRNAEVELDGTVISFRGWVLLKLLGNISTKNLKIEFSPALPRESNAHLVYTPDLLDMDFALPDGNDHTQVKSIFVALSKYSIGITSPLFLNRIRCDFGDRIRVMIEPDPRKYKFPEYLELDPSKSFFIQPDGSVIGSIKRILRDKNNLYGSTLITQSGETWVLRADGNGYTKARNN